ncbi:hypothetical protein EJ05DRAFT_472681 [Pseudovirgaria hyperparasitica]|uniref:Uncharacterized protein n=1 Tax=Pseudovirgaria hyperparasitica TaxID=470096 RepID=A0A6A6WG24_9PEZI|nr:uncharacterized protein EJ05DRAFT_472681 [Pseudovirgaria hyperparasitica]KAF2761713.1 hypothetical protein EJ05DRAFT_472681 [Pseudovirgaria hyperparasitica]
MLWILACFLVRGLAAPVGLYMLTLASDGARLSESTCAPGVERSSSAQYADVRPDLTPRHSLPRIPPFSAQIRHPSI